MLDLSTGFGRQQGGSGGCQLRLKPAVRLLFGMPCAVSPIEPDMLTPSIASSLCSSQ
jgi:hypothetical protein